jgi:hypothetical protein
MSFIIRSDVHRRTEDISFYAALGMSRTSCHGISPAGW